MALKKGEEENNSIDSYLSPENLSFFGDEIRERGEEYFREGRVRLTYKDLGTGEVHANVEGSYDYAVRLDFKGKRLVKAGCNCPYASKGPCKHAAATLYALDADLSSLSEPLPKIEPSALSPSSSSPNNGAASMAAFGAKLHSFSLSLMANNSGAKAFIAVVFPYFYASVPNIPSAVPVMLSNIIFALKHDFRSYGVSEGAKEAAKAFSSLYSDPTQLFSAVSSFMPLLERSVAETCFLALLRNEGTSEAAKRSFEKSVEKKDRTSWAFSLFGANNTLAFWPLLSEEGKDMCLTLFRSGTAGAHDLAYSIIKDNDGKRLSAYCARYGFSCLPYDGDDKIGSLLMEAGDRKSAIDYSLEKLSYCSFPSFMKFFSMMSPEERKGNAASLASLARMGRFYNSYSLLTTPLGLKGYSFTGILIDDIPLMLPFLNTEDPSFLPALKKKIDLSLKSEFKMSSDLNFILDLIEALPSLKDYLLNPLIAEASAKSYLVRPRYLTLLRKYSLFEAAGLRRYE